MTAAINEAIRMAATPQKMSGDGPFSPAMGCASGVGGLLNQFGASVLSAGPGLLNHALGGIKGFVRDPRGRTGALRQRISIALKRMDTILLFVITASSLLVSL